MKKNRIQMVLAVLVVGAGVLLAALLGLWAFMSATPPLHPDAGSVRTVAQSPPADEWRAAVDQARQVVRAAVAEQNLPGLSVAVGTDGGIVWAEGFGWADLDNRVAVTPETRFRIGTASIALTSAAVGVLLERGLLKLDEPIQTYVPEFPRKPWPVTLRQLMAHTSGLRNDGGDEGPLFGKSCERPVEALEAFAGGDLRFEPGTEYRFSSYGWIVMSAAVETAAGEPFMRFMRRQVFEPLGMERTRADAAAGVTSDSATPYFPRFAADPRYGPDPMRPVDYSCYAGASAFLSTPSDLVRFALAINGGKLLQADTLTRLQTSQRLPSGAETGYGLGWDLETVTAAGAERRTVGHAGDVLGGQAAAFLTFPDLGLVVAVTSNTSYADAEGLAVKVADVFGTRRTPAARQRPGTTPARRP